MSNYYDKELVSFNYNVSKNDYVDSYVSYQKCMGKLKGSLMVVLVSCLIIAACVLYLLVNMKSIDHNLIGSYIVIAMFFGFVIYYVNVVKVNKIKQESKHCYDSSSFAKQNYSATIYKGHIELKSKSSKVNISYADMKALIENKTCFVLVSSMVARLIIIPKSSIEAEKLHEVKNALDYGFTKRKFEVNM